MGCSRSLVKRYGVLFTCLTIRAVHIEVAHSLDTDSFLLALRRFIARRGQVREMRSDNGTNFTSGKRELRESIQAWNNNKISEEMLQKNIKWSFNPPYGSHHGGIWERCIRSVRRILRALLQEQSIDDEGLVTLMCEVESILNSRPITFFSDDPADPEPLTPNHLLLLKCDSPMPPGVFQKEDVFSRRRWRQIQYLSDIFWKDGQGSTFHCCRFAKNGYFPEEIWLLAMLSLSPLKTQLEIVGCLEESKKFSQIRKA